MKCLCWSVVFLLVLVLGAGCGSTPPTGPVQTSLGKGVSFGAGQASPPGALHK
jgi:hypothetical protein